MPPGHGVGRAPSGTPPMSAPQSFNNTVNPLARPGLGRSRLTNGWQLNVTGPTGAGLFHPRRAQPRELDDTFHDPLARVAISLDGHKQYAGLVLLRVAWTMSELRNGGGGLHFEPPHWVVGKKL